MNIADIFVDITCRDILKYFLMTVRPPIFGAVARLNRHCAEVARSLIEDKQQQWLIIVYSGDPKGVWRNYRFMHNGRNHGRVKVWINGVLRKEVDYYNDVPHGVYKFYDPFGKIAEECTYVHGDRHGQYTRWRGDIMVEQVNYVHGLRDGVHREWNNIGTLIREFNYKIGKRHGLCTTWHHNGKKSSEYMAEDDSICGVMTRWYRNGTVMCETTYDRGVRHGEYRAYSTNGMLIERIQYVNGCRHGLVEQWYNNGQLKLSVEYREGDWHGLASKWLSDGTLKYRCNFKKGRPVNVIYALSDGARSISPVHQRSTPAYDV